VLRAGSQLGQPASVARSLPPESAWFVLPGTGSSPHCRIVLGLLKERGEGFPSNC